VAQDVVDASDVVIEIPQFGTKHSLNISVSCGVVVWDLFSKMKIFGLLLLLLLTVNSCKKEVKNSDLSNTDKIYLNKVIDSIYELDQGVRHGFGKLDSLYGLEDNFMFKRLSERTKNSGDKFDWYDKKTDSLWALLEKNDASNSRLLIDLTNKYGFPNNERLGVYKSKSYMIFVHAPNEYFEEITLLVNKEFEGQRMSEYKKEYIFWHINGRKGSPPMSGEHGEAIWN
jgi:hypothetical protein